MTATNAQRIVDDYLTALDRELQGMPSADRRELTTQIANHIAEARGRLEHETDADVLNILEQLGSPADLAREAGAAPVERRRPGAMEVAALATCVVLLPLGILLTWLSQVFTVRQKLTATLIPPVLVLLLLAVPALIFDVRQGGFLNIHPAFLIVLSLLPGVNPLGMVTALYLGISAWRSR